MQIHACLVLFILFVTRIQACGVGTHLTLLARASVEFGNDLDVPNAQAGAFFPDAFYSCLGQSEGAEAAHWPPFLKVAVDYWREKYGDNENAQQLRDQVYAQGLLSWVYPPRFRGNVKQNSENGLALKSFIYGILTHQVADISWHSLGVHQGLLSMIAERDFEGDIDRAHNAIDAGGDFILVKRLLNSGLGLDWYNLDRPWDYPTEDIIEIMKRAGYSTSKTALDYCMLRGRGALEMEFRLARTGYQSFAQLSPTLYRELDSYYMGGTEEMTVAIRRCVPNLQQWFLHGTPDDPWSLCTPYFGRHPMPSTITLASQCTNDLPAHVDENVYEFAQAAQNPETYEPLSATLLTTNMEQGLFGASIAAGSFLGRPSFAISAPLESKKGSVYVMEAQNITLAQNGLTDMAAVTEIADLELAFNPSRAPSNSRDFDDRFGHAICPLNLGIDTDLLAVSTPGQSSITLFLKGAEMGYIYCSQAVTEYGSHGLKQIGITLTSGDLDGDGVDELIIGAPYSDVDGIAQQGKVFVVNGASLSAMVLGNGKLDICKPAKGVEIIDLPSVPTQSKLQYAQFGARLTVVRRQEARALLIGAPGTSNVYGFKLENGKLAQAFAISSDESVKSDFGGALLTSDPHNNNGWIAVGDSAETLAAGRGRPDCVQCGMVYLYRMNPDTTVAFHSKFHLGDKVSFTRFGQSGTMVGDQLLIASPHAKKDQGQLWKVILGPDNVKQATLLIDHGPMPYSGGFGTAIDAIVSNTGTLIMVGMPHYGNQFHNQLMGAVAAYNSEDYTNQQNPITVVP
uniref:Phosphatidylinositol-glycan-specific phospholipase D n=1 Tax=Blastobotrys adeninivorans TaxID=409370 RepID=A0A060T7C0_BLAAD